MWNVFGANIPEMQSLFQTGWFVVGLLTQLLIVHMIRTQHIPFLQSTAASTSFDAYRLSYVYRDFPSIYQFKYSNWFNFTSILLFSVVIGNFNNVCSSYSIYKENIHKEV